MLILKLLLQHFPIQEQHVIKENLVQVGDFGSYKVIFLLLTEVIAMYVSENFI